MTKINLNAINREGPVGLNEGSKKAVFDGKLFDSGATASIDSDTLSSINKITLIIPPNSKVTMTAQNMAAFPKDHRLEFVNNEGTEKKITLRIKPEELNKPLADGQKNFPFTANKAKDQTNNTSRQHKQIPIGHNGVSEFKLNNSGKKDYTNWIRERETDKTDKYKTKDTFKKPADKPLDPQSSRHLQSTEEPQNGESQLNMECRPNSTNEQRNNTSKLDNSRQPQTAPTSTSTKKN